MKSMIVLKELAEKTVEHNKDKLANKNVKLAQLFSEKKNFKQVTCDLNSKLLDKVMDEANKEVWFDNLNSYVGARIENSRLGSECFSR